MSTIFVLRTAVCRALGLDRHALKRMIDCGAIRTAPGLKRYVYRDDVERWLAKMGEEDARCGKRMQDAKRRNK